MPTPDQPWHDDRAQFAHLLDELNNVGALTPDIITALTTETTLTHDHITNLLNRAHTAHNTHNTPAIIDTTTTDTLRASITHLDHPTRTAITRMINTVERDEHHHHVLTHIRTTLTAHDLHTAVGVVFRASFIHDTWRLPHHGWTLYADPTSASGYHSVEIDFGATFDTTLNPNPTANNKPTIDHRTRLVVDLRTNTITTDRDTHLTLYHTFQPE